MFFKFSNLSVATLYKIYILFYFSWFYTLKQSYNKIKNNKKE